jgi:molecular chaperone GrpE
MLEKYNVKEIDAQGKPFDPKFHEAVMMVQSDEYESETVVEVLQKGYLYHSKVIRPSMVKVAKK